MTMVRPTPCQLVQILTMMVLTTTLIQHLRLQRILPQQISQMANTSASFPNANTPGTPELDWREIDPTDTDNDGVVDAIDVDDDNDGIKDEDECPSDPTYITAVQSQSGVTNSGNVTGAPDGNFGEWHSNGDVADLDFGSVYPAGTQYTITWKERTGQTGTAEIVLAESLDDASYSAHSTNPTTNSTSFITTTVTSDISFRYIRLTKLDGTGGADYHIDAVTILSNDTDCDIDGDGIINRLDLDSDNDGIPDIVGSWWCGHRW